MFIYLFNKYVPQGVCYDKDEVPVDVDALYDDECVDACAGNHECDGGA